MRAIGDRGARKKVRRVAYKDYRRPRGEKRSEEGSV